MLKFSGGSILLERRKAPVTVICAILCAAAAFSAARPLLAESSPTKPADAYYEGKQIVFISAAPSRRSHMVQIGDAVLGPLVTGRKPDDSRLNLYVVSPGQQHHDPATQGRDFNLIVNAIPQSDEPVVWDVYWVLVLDPALKTDFTGERELLLAAQDGFTPDKHSGIDEVPSAAFLREYLHINSFAGLESFRREDGMVPRVIMVSAGMAVRASAADPENPPHAANNLARALSHLHRK